LFLAGTNKFVSFTYFGISGGQNVDNKIEKNAKKVELFKFSFEKG